MNENQYLLLVQIKEVYIMKEILINSLYNINSLLFLKIKESKKK